MASLGRSGARVWVALGCSGAALECSGAALGLLLWACWSGMLWGCIGLLWVALECSGVSLGCSGTALESLGLLWAAPGLLWSALGCWACSWSVGCSCSCCCCRCYCHCWRHCSLPFPDNFKSTPFNFLQTSKGFPLHVLRITLKFQTESSSISLRYQRVVH